jgi:hypothetical protein
MGGRFDFRMGGRFDSRTSGRFHQNLQLPMAEREEFLADLMEGAN